MQRLISKIKNISKKALGNQRLSVALFVLVFAGAGTALFINSFATGYTTAPCGTAPTSPQPITHVIWIVFENHGTGQIYGNSSNPYMNGLATSCGSASNMIELSHPSLPNYIGLTSGSIQGLAGDDSDPSSHVFGVPNIFSQVEAKGLTWKSLEEDMPSNCDKSNSGNYAVRHNPAAYYTNINCSANDIPLSLSSTADISSNFTFVTPNLCNDMHDCGSSSGDTWLQSFMQNQVLNTPQYANGSTAVFITFDEDGGSSTPLTPVPFYVVSPYVTPHHSSSVAYTHNSTLATTEDLLGLGRISGSVGAPTFINDFGLFPSSTTGPPPPPAQPTVSLSASPASITSGSTSKLSWSSQNATSCTASGSWSGSQATSGSFTTPALSATSTYTLLCTGTGGSASSSTTVTVTASSTPPPPPSPDPSGQPLPLGDISGWHQIFADDFTVNAAQGSWATTSASKVVYTGDHSGQWYEYPDGWPSTYTNGSPGYYPSQVLSVHDGELDFNLHSYNGAPAGANPSPVLPAGSQYQTYGRYTARLKVTFNDAQHLDSYHMAWLLWPNLDSDYQLAESDFPELTLNNSQLCAFSHYGGSGSQDSNCSTIDMTQWHTYTQEWGPGYRKYYIDNTLIGTSTNQVFSNPERWQLQIEPSGTNDTSSGHVLVDWVAVYSNSPTTQPPATPSVSLTAPANNGSVSGLVNISAVTAAPVSYVEFYVDNQLVNTEQQQSNNSYNYTWNTALNTSNGSHTIAVKAYASGSSTPGTASANVTVNNVVVQPPSTPSNLAASINAAGQVGLSWKSVGTQPASYQINRSGGSGNMVFSAPGSATSYTDTSVQPSTKYTYTIQAVDSQGKTSAASSSVSATTPAAVTAPQVSITSPSDGQQVTNSVTVTAKVTAGSSPIKQVEFDLDGVAISNCTFTSGTTTFSCPLNTANVSAGNHIVSVRVTDSAQNVATDQIKIEVQKADTAAPTVPSGVSAKASSYNKVQVSWSASTDTGGSGLGGYYILRNTNSGPYTTIGQVGAGVTTYADNSTLASTTYNYEVEAFDNAGNVSSASSSVTLLTPAASSTPGKVSTPAQLSAMPSSSTQMNLTWKAASAPSGIAGYDVYRDGVRIATVQQTSYGDAGLKADTAYSYYVIARDNAGDSSKPSATVTATTMSTNAGIIIYGTITNAENKHLMPRVRVSYSYHDSVHYTYSDDNGNYSLAHMSEGRHTVTFQKAHYETVRKEIRMHTNQEINLNIRMHIKHHEHDDDDRVGDD